jgi:hypothetical protein
MTEAFEARFALARFSTGAVVVDLGSGNYYRVNGTAALVCDALLQGGDAVGRVANEFQVGRPEASALIAEVVTGLSAPPVRSTPPGAYHFFPVEEGYVLRHGDRSVLEVDASGKTIRLSAGDLARDSTLLEFYVRALAPKLLFQRHVMVVHASSCLMASGGLIAFAGLSGAGKTTTARAFAAAGLSLVSEDLLVLIPGAGAPRAALQAEVFVHDWARGIAARLLETEGAVTAGDLLGAIQGPTAPVETILVLDRSRRAGQEIALRTLEAPDALVALMTHAFLGAREQQSWRRYLADSSAVIAAIETKEATVPSGVERLADAAASYISKRAS